MINLNLGEGPEVPSQGVGGTGGGRGGRPLQKMHPGRAADCDRPRARVTAAVPRRDRSHPVDVDRTVLPDLVTLGPTDRLPSHAMG